MRGSVSRHGPTWRYRFDEGVAADGKRRQYTRGGFPTQKKAQEELRKAMDQIEQGVSPDASKMTVSEWLDAWLLTKKRIRPTTLLSYESHVRVHLKPLVGHIPLRQLRAEHLDEMYAGLEAGRSAATLHRIHATLRAALNSAVKRRLMTWNPANQVELPQVPKVRRKFLTPAQLDHFLQEIREDRLYAAYYLLADTGMRRGEVCGLRWSDLDLDAEVPLLTVEQARVQCGSATIISEPKSGASREVPLGADAVAILKGHRKLQAAERLAWPGAWPDHDLVFTKPDGQPVRPDYVTKHFQSRCEAAGLARMRLHELRHTHATHLKQAGVDLKVAQARLGHSTIAMTADIYTHVPDVMAVGAANAAASLREAVHVEQEAK